MASIEGAEVWIATSGQPGGGTSEQDPFVVTNSQMFDNLMLQLMQTNDTTVHLMSGIFYTDPLNHEPRWALASGTHLLGDSSTIKMEPENAYFYWRGVIQSQDEASSIYIYNLTVDGNINNEDDYYAINGIDIYTDYSVILNVQVVNIGSTNTGYEAFGITMHGTDNSVYYCEVSSVFGDYVSGIAMDGNDAASVTGCDVQFPRIDAQDIVYNAAYNCAGLNVEFYNNHSYGALYGLFSDYGDISGLFALDNHFEDCYRGIWIDNGNTPSGICLYNNDIDLSPAYFSSWVKTGIACSQQSANYAIQYNSIEMSDLPENPPGDGIWALILWDIDDVLIELNTKTTGMCHNISTNQNPCTNIDSDWPTGEVCP
jgi:hypothetical protein